MNCLHLTINAAPKVAKNNACTFRLCEILDGEMEISLWDLVPLCEARSQYIDLFKELGQTMKFNLLRRLLRALKVGMYIDTVTSGIYFIKRN
jgi:hypothetical protein